MGTVRKVLFIVARLVEDEEAYKDKTNEKIEQEILSERPRIPYVAEIEKVTVLDYPSASQQHETRPHSYFGEGKSH